MTDPIEREELIAWTLITEERTRQITVEGWTPEHDDQHKDGELLHAAVFYLHHGTPLAGPTTDGVPLGWEWEAEWWKPKDRKSNLVRAGALCLAERDRRVRANLPTGPADHKLGLCLRDLIARLSDKASIPVADPERCDACLGCPSRPPEHERHTMSISWSSGMPIRDGWIEIGPGMSVPKEALIAKPHINWRHIDGPLMTWAGQMHWLTFGERIALAVKMTTATELAERLWPHLAKIKRFHRLQNTSST